MRVYARHRCFTDVSSLYENSDEKDGDDEMENRIGRRRRQYETEAQQQYLSDLLTTIPSKTVCCYRGITADPRDRADHVYASANFCMRFAALDTPPSVSAPVLEC